MDSRILFEKLNQFSPISDEAWEDLKPLFQKVTLEKGEFLIREGDRAHYAFLLINGVVRVYHSYDGNEYNKTFFIPGMFPTPITALISSEPCNLNFQTLTNSGLYRFSYADFTKLFDKHRCLETLLLRILEQQWIKKEIHDIRMVTNDATTNYLTFRETYPGLENLIPQYHIASYLGITPIQLSRIRAQLAKK